MDDSFLLPVLLSTLQNVQQGGLSSASAQSSETLQDFKSLLLSMSSGLGTSTADAGGLSLSGMLPLYEQLLSLQIQNEYQSSSTASSGSVNVLGALKPAHINQFDAEIQVGGNGANADCGPTSLVMALHQLGLGVAGERTSSSSGEAVDLARRSMAGSCATDGVDAHGNRCDAEHNAYTSFADLARGAAAAGVKSERLAPNASAIARALQTGSSVIVSGTFVGKSPLPWTGDRGSDNQSAPGNAREHIIEVSAYNAATGLFTIHDPARKQPHQVTGAALERFMAGNAGAMALHR